MKKQETRLKLCSLGIVYWFSFGIVFILKNVILFFKHLKLNLKLSKTSNDCLTVKLFFNNNWSLAFITTLKSLIKKVLKIDDVL